LASIAFRPISGCSSEAPIPQASAGAEKRSASAVDSEPYEAVSDSDGK
jgi:hypothetical protein